METCPHCGRENTHYMTHICPDCTCYYTEVRIPGEPHIPPYLEAEQNPDCPIHGYDDSPVPQQRANDEEHLP